MWFIHMKTAVRSKGGLNKRFDSDRPGVYGNIFAYDIASAYPHALKFFKFPLWEPKHLGSKKMTAHEIALICNKNHWSVWNVSFRLPEGTPEKDRVLLQYDADYCFTGLVAENQFYSDFEMMALAVVHPELEVTVHDALIWEPSTDGRYADFGQYMSFLLEERKKVGKKTPLGTQFKLLANSLCGKFAQKTTGVDPELMQETLVNSGTVSNTANGATYKSKITCILIFNQITGMVRAAMALAARDNDAILTVTDSVITRNHTFIQAGVDYETGHSKLDSWCSFLTFEKEHEDKTLICFKERDYAIFDINPDYLNEVLNGLESEGNLTSVQWNSVTVIKAARRGYKSKPYNNIKDEKKRKQAQNKEWLFESLPRLHGGAMEFVEKKLATASEFLQNGVELGVESSKEKMMGGENIRYDCRDFREFHRRRKRKEKCREKGFADYLHCQADDPELAEKIDKQTTSMCKPKVKNKLPVEARRAVIALNQYSPKHFSMRRIAEKMGVSHTTLNNWKKDYDNSLIRSLLDDKDFEEKIVQLVVDFEDLTQEMFLHRLRVDFEPKNPDFAEGEEIIDLTNGGREVNQEKESLGERKDRLAKAREISEKTRLSKYCLEKLEGFQSKEKSIGLTESEKGEYQNFRTLRLDMVAEEKESRLKKSKPSFGFQVC